MITVASIERRIAALERAAGIGPQVAEDNETARAWRRLESYKGTWQDVAQVTDLTELHNLRALIVLQAGWYVQLREQNFEHRVGARRCGPPGGADRRAYGRRHPASPSPRSVA